MKKVYTPKTNQLSYIEYTDKELQEIKVLQCDHLIHERRNAIVLVHNETIIQRLISCRVCNTHGNAIDINAKNEKV